MDEATSDLIVKKKEEIRELQKQLLLKEAELEGLFKRDAINVSPLVRVQSLSNEAILRYSRQMILPELRPEGQKKLLSSSVLIVGCGGLGCPSALYLAGAGIGRLGLIDHDSVDTSNLHRQIGHSEVKLGVNKAVSLASALHQLNSDINVVPHITVLDSSNALEVIRGYDIVLDCTDNVATRYLLSDACVILDKPLVSGSALRWEGQLTVYNYKNGPTYRCLYPQPPAPESVTNCSDGGVIGPVVGIIACHQALETVKILSGTGTSFSGVMMVFDGLEGKIRNMRLRGRVENEVSKVTKLVDYVQFCGAAATDKEAGVSLLGSEDRVTVQQLEKVRTSDAALKLVDVRSEPEMEICSIDKSVNIPLTELQYDGNWEKIKSKLNCDTGESVYVICRRGNDSQIATTLLRKLLPDCSIKDVIGGLHAWSKHIDHSFPVY